MTDINLAPGFSIEKADTAERYEGLRDLWCRVFGDAPEYVDAFYGNFGGDITGYTAVDENGSVCSALTRHLCGTYEGRPVYVSYAICTREDMRGKGLAAALASLTRDEAAADGGISILSPAEPSLVSYYEQLGYEPYFFAVEETAMSPDLDSEEFDDFTEFDLDIEGADPAPVTADLDLRSIPACEYNRYREEFLSGRPHIEPSAAMLRLIESETKDGQGLYLINRGDAICAVSSADAEAVRITELIPSPALKAFSSDIDYEIASQLAKHFGSARAVYTTPGAGACQGMIWGLTDGTGTRAGAEEEFCGEPYYGFPIQ